MFLLGLKIWDNFYMSQQSDTDALFESLKNLDIISIDPELKKVFDLVAIYQVALDSSTDFDNDSARIVQELNEKLPCFGETVTITGEIFSAAMGEDGASFHGSTSVEDKDVRSHGFTVWNRPQVVEGVPIGDKPTIALLFVDDDEKRTSANSDLILIQHSYLAIGYVDQLQVDMSNPSPEHQRNIAHEFAPKETLQVEALFAGKPDHNEAIRALKDVRIEKKDDSIRDRGLRALVDHAYNIANVDQSIPYSVMLKDEYYLDFGNETSSDKKIEVKVGTVGNIPRHFIADIINFNLLERPAFLEDEVIGSADLHWHVQLGLYGKEHGDEIYERITIPVCNITGLLSIREFFGKLDS
jgi:hypothetical protein